MNTYLTTLTLLAIIVPVIHGLWTFKADIQSCDSNNAPKPTQVTVIDCYKRENGVCVYKKNGVAKTRIDFEVEKEVNSPYLKIVWLSDEGREVSVDHKAICPEISNECPLESGEMVKYTDKEDLSPYPEIGIFKYEVSINDGMTDEPVICFLFENGITED